MSSAMVSCPGVERRPHGRTLAAQPGAAGTPAGSLVAPGAREAVGSRAPRRDRAADRRLRQEAAGGVVLLLGAAAALAWANAAHAACTGFWGRRLGVGALGLELDLRYWVNDALMRAVDRRAGRVTARSGWAGAAREPASLQERIWRTGVRGNRVLIGPGTGTCHPRAHGDRRSSAQLRAATDAGDVADHRPRAGARCLT